MHVTPASAAAAVGLANGTIKPNKAPALHFAWDAQPASVTPAATRTALLNAFLQLATSKPFAAHSGTVRVAGAMIAQAADPDKHVPNAPHTSTFVPLLYAPILLDQLVACIYPELGH
jgi:hypothetical protein